MSPEGITAMPGPMVPLLNTGSGTSASGTTVPSSGEAISVVTPASSAALVAEAAAIVPALAPAGAVSRSRDGHPGGLELGLLLGRLVAGDDHQGHRGEERRGDGDGVQRHVGERRDGQQRGEHEGAGLHAAADADDDAADQTADQHSRIYSFEPQVNTVERRFGDTAEQAGGQRAGRGLPHLRVALPPGQEAAHRRSRRSRRSSTRPSGPG